jgi:hypothetical protein
MRLTIYTVTLMTITVVYLFSSLPATSKKASPPAGNCGDPLTNVTCAKSGCHSGTAAVNDSKFTITINGQPLSGFSYVPGVTYSMNLVLDNGGTAPVYGFQLSALSGVVSAGTLAVTNISNTKVSTLSGVQYMGHNAANSNNNWTFNWTAPAAGLGNVTFYYSGLSGNGNNGTSGDMVYKSSATISELVSSISEWNGVENVRLFPNPVQHRLMVSWEQPEAESISLSLLTADGRVCLQQKAEGHEASFDVENLPSGLYFLQITNGTQHRMEKFVKH